MFPQWCQSRSCRQVALASLTLLCLWLLYVFHIPLSYMVGGGAMMPAVDSQITVRSTSVAKYGSSESSSQGLLSNLTAVGFPLLLHQIFFNYSKMPDKWPSYIVKCREVNKDYRYVLWDRSAVERLLAEDYPWFLDTFRRYPYDIQRADSARYFILHKHGGVYLDMDTKCQKKINSLLVNVTSGWPREGDLEAASVAARTQCILPLGDAATIVQHIIICRPQSSFMLQLIVHLQSFNNWYILPYLTVMLSTGPLFVTSCLGNYPNKDLVYLMPRRQTDMYFGNAMGRTWFSWDGYYLNRTWDVYIPRLRNFVVLLSIPLTLIAAMFIYRKYRNGLRRFAFVRFTS